MPVIAGIDDSPVVGSIVAKAAEEAAWRDTTLHLVHVIQTPVTYSEVPIDWTAIHEAERQAVWARVADEIEKAPVEVEKVDLEGYPPDTLVSYASEVQAELLVVGTRGRGDLASLILGSTSHRALHLAECDVLVVKASAD